MVTDSKPIPSFFVAHKTLMLFGYHLHLQTTQRRERGIQLWSMSSSKRLPGKVSELAQARCYNRRRQWQPTPVLLPGKSHGRRSLVGCSPWGHEESDTTEQLHFEFSLSCIGEGDGNPLHCSCLENPRDGRAWWAAIYGVVQSRARLGRLSSSSCCCYNNHAPHPYS